MSTNSKPSSNIGLNLRTLQSICARRFGMSASETMAAATDLYERSAISYPRSDSRVLPEHLRPDAAETLKTLAALSPFLAASARAADPAYRSTVWVANDDADVLVYMEIEAAIHPLRTADGRNFNDAMRNVFEVVARHYIDLFDPLKSPSPVSGEHRHFTLSTRPMKAVRFLGTHTDLFGPSYHVVDNCLVLAVTDGVSGEAWLKIPEVVFSPLMAEFPFTSIADLAARNPKLLEQVVSIANDLVLPDGRGLFVCAEKTFRSFNGLRTYIWPEHHRADGVTATANAG